MLLTVVFQQKAEGRHQSLLYLYIIAGGDKRCKSTCKSFLIEKLSHSYLVISNNCLANCLLCWHGNVWTSDWCWLIIAFTTPKGGALKFEMVKKEKRGNHLYPPCMSLFPQSAFVFPRRSWGWWQPRHAHAAEGHGFVTFSEISAVLFSNRKNAPDQHLYLIPGLWGKGARHLHWLFQFTLRKSLVSSDFFFAGNSSNITFGYFWMWIRINIHCNS